MMFVSCMCLFFLPLVPGPDNVPSGEHHQARGGYVTYISAGIQLYKSPEGGQLKNQQPSKSPSSASAQKRAFSSCCGTKGMCRNASQRHSFKSNQIKSNQITFIVTSPQHKCLGEWNSYERAPDSAKKQQTIYLWTDSAKKQQTIYLWTDSAKKQQTIYIWTDSAKKLHWSIYSAPDSAKKQQQQFTYGQTVQKKTTAIYIWTDSAKNNSNLHMDSTYLQTVQKTMCKIHIHILSTLSVL